MRIAILAALPVIISACGGATPSSTQLSDTGGGPARLTTLHSFVGSDGGGPNSLVLDSTGNLFGTAYGGGGTNYGTVFELKRNSDGTYAAATTLHLFTGSDGGGPNSLVLDSAGNLFGIANAGHSDGSYGRVFELKRNSDGTYAAATTLHLFTESDGIAPTSLVLDSVGNLFGTASGGGSNYGAIFELKRNGDGTYAGQLTTLHSFTGSDGGGPNSLILDSAGNLFGTDSGGNGSANYGTVFELRRNSDGTYAAATTLHSFTGSDGDEPNSLLLDSAGNLFGAASSGGGSNYGAIFELKRNGDGTYAAATTLHSFMGSDGGGPKSLILDNAGNLFGIANAGYGSTNYGRVFELKRNSDGTYAAATTLHSFAIGDGAAPNSLVLDSAGNLFGTAYGGGGSNWGTVFELN